VATSKTKVASSKAHHVTPVKTTNDKHATAKATHKAAPAKTVAHKAVAHKAKKK
jgi:hypothetical protein